MSTELIDLLRDHLHDPACGVSVGGFGALAEFQDDTVALEGSHAGLCARSPRGAVAVTPRGDERVLAYEALSAREDAWQCGIGVLAARHDARMAGRRTLTEIGPDRDALDPDARDDLLFDLGVGLPHVDFCVRTADATLVDLLRKHAGEPVISDGHAVMEAVIDAGPPRVVRSRIARVEVYQPIDRHRTPDGPHTHLLPGLLKSGRTHSASLPFPAGSVPLIMLHPENPLTDRFGQRRAFAAAVHARFQARLERFGDPDYVAEKRRVADAVSARVAPETCARPNSRVTRLARRVALRQLGHTGVESDYLARWQARAAH